MIDVLLAASDLASEPELVRIAPTHGLRIARRCVDAVALLAAATQAPEALVVLSAGLPRVSTDAVHRLASGRMVIGLADDDAESARLRALGVDAVVRVGPTPEATMHAIVEARQSPASVGVWGTGIQPAAPERPPDRGAPAAALGRIVAVWGPLGAPGRTTVACGIAEALAEDGRRVCLVDADTYAPGVTLDLGVVEDASGLVVACRQADAGALTPSVLAATARTVRGSWSVLGGLSAPARWTDLRTSALDRVWSACRSTFDVTVVDVGFCLEDDDADGAWARQRNGAARTALAGADHAVAVSDASDRGLARLVQGWPDFDAVASTSPRTVVRNRADGGRSAWQRSLAAAGVAVGAVEVPADAAALHRCWRHGRSLGEGAPRSRLRPALGEVAGQVVSG